MALLSPTGRLACSLATEFGGKIHSVAVTTRGPGEEEAVHDEAADVDPESLRVEGGELVWTRGGARRSVPFP